MKLNYIKYLLVFIKEFILNNKIKLLFLKISIILFSFAGTIPDNIVYNKIVKEVKIDDKTFLYIKSSIKNNEMNYEVIKSDKPQRVTNGILVTSEYNDGNVAMWVFFGIISFVLFIFTLSTWGESEGWEIEDCLRVAFLSLVTCEFEDGKFYYICCGKLIGISDHKKTHQYILGDFRVNGFDELKTCPKFETKEQRRENKLNKIGIK